MQKKMSKKGLAFILVAVCLVGLIGIGISYSYYLANIRTSNEENKNSNITTTTITKVVMDMQGKVSSGGAYPGHKMVKEVVVRGIGESNSIPANASIKITPDLGEFSSDVTWKLYKSEEAITCSTVEHTDSGKYYEDATCNIPTNASLVLEGSSDSDYLNIVVSPNTETKYYLVVEYANRSGKDQNDQMGKSFSIDIGIGEKITSMSDKITDLAKTDTINLATDDVDNNVRYIGANPNNYVYFNCSDYANPTANTCELWRIIGVFNNVTKGDGFQENLVKIIRADSIGSYTYDRSRPTSAYGIAYWPSADLMNLLNPGYEKSSINGSLYYYAKSGTCYYYNDEYNLTIDCDFTEFGLKNNATRNAIEEAVWNIGGYDGSAPVATAKIFYEKERGTTVCNGRATTWTGKVGLMYPSDYGYATSGSSTVDRKDCLNNLTNWRTSNEYSECITNNYLYHSNSDSWLLMPNSDIFNANFLLYSGFISDTGVMMPYDIYPTLYLKSNISFKFGDGTMNNPYQLSVQ